VNMHIASHNRNYESCRLRACDSDAKLLKTQPLNRLDTRNILLTKLYYGTDVLLPDSASHVENRARIF
jgi:hypothetical protein